MNKLFALLSVATLAFTFSANAAIKGAPFIPEVDARFNSLEIGSGIGANSLLESQILSPAGLSGEFVARVAKAIVPLTVAAGTYNTSIVLPANSIIRQAYIFVDAAVTPSGTTTAFQCDSANDILSAADETGVSANGFIAGVETGTAATMHYSSAGCTVKVVTAVHTGTAGKMNLFLDYVVAK